MIVNAESDKPLQGNMRTRILPGMSKVEESRVAANLTWLMERKNLNANSLAVELARLGTPVPQPTIFRIQSGESRDPRTSSLQPLADFFGVTVAALREHDFTKEGLPQSMLVFQRVPKMRNLVSADDTDEPTGEIPYWDAKGSCGGGRMNWEDHPSGNLIKEASFFKKYHLKPSNAVAIYADGDSMADFIVDGDIVIFDRSKTEPRSGRIFLIEHPEGLRIKQLRRSIDGSWILESRNADKRQYPDEAIHPSHAELLKIVGEFVYRQGG
ncbi:XRE family transcriptional regulator [Ralstonia sp. 22111]|uniref:XRE family transcriptional regulator n=1 Tax=Ralstonia sp. 22111 TaxID=3453878 RepID=UPI003F831AF6